MKYIQYTIRGIPDEIDKSIRRIAQQDGKSLNTAVIDTLSRGLGYRGSPPVYDDLDDLAGTWVEDPEFDAVIADMRRIDPEMWK